MIDFSLLRGIIHMYAIAFDFFIFLDVSQYLAPSVSYDALLKAYDCRQCKGYFSI